MTYNIGPKLGDFIHGLVIPKYIYDTTGEKATIYISNEGCTFSAGLNKTYEELLPIISKQEYVEDFQIYNGEKIDYEVFRFRQSPYIFKEGWSKVYFSLLDKEPPTNYPWLVYPTPPSNKIVMNRSPRNFSLTTKENYVETLSNFKVDFIFSEQIQYDSFPLKDMVNPLYCPTLEDMVKEISACSVFIGNQSAPLAIAVALGKTVFAELRRNPDAPHYEKEKQYNTSLTTFIGD